MAVDRRVTRASLTNKASVAATFAGETPEQIVKHQKIARRYRRSHDGAFLIARLRVAEMQWIFFLLYGEKPLPHDDAGRTLLRLVADHLAQRDPRLIRPWAETWMPTLPAAELDALIASVGTGRRWKADALARELGLDDATRTRLNIKTIGAIDCSKAQRLARRRRKRIAADRARRAKAGARPHAQSAERLMPWIDEGVSRSTWYRRRAKVVTDETNSRPIDLPSLLKANESHEAEACHEASGSATDSEGAHGGEASTITAKPLPSPSFRVHQSSDQAKTDQIAGLDNVAFRAVHHEHYQLLCVTQRSPEQKARLLELNGIIETERVRRALRRPNSDWPPLLPLSRPPT